MGYLLHDCVVRREKFVGKNNHSAHALASSFFARCPLCFIACSAKRRVPLAAAKSPRLSQCCANTDKVLLPFQSSWNKNVVNQM